MENIEFIVYYKTADKEYRCYNYKTSEHNYIYSLPNNISNFYLPSKTKQKYQASDVDLKNYAHQLLKDRNEVLNISNFDYFQYICKNTGKQYTRNHSKSIESFFNMYSKNNVNYDLHDKITKTEHKWMSKCNNGGIMYTQKGSFYNCHGYDYSAFYQNIMIDDNFIIPYCEGKETKMKIIPKSLYFGFYRVKIECDDKDFNKIFMYSKDDVYTHYSLKFAMKHKQQYDIKINLIVDEEPNAYIYLGITNKKSQCMKFKDVCQKWSDKLNLLKSQCSKDNTIIKMLSSSLWGHLSRKKWINKTMEQAENEGLLKTHIVIKQFYPNDDGTVNFKLVDANDIYFYNFRLKPFITSFGRAKTGETAIQMGLENIIRIHTDGIITTKQFNSDIDKFIIDEKHTGDFNLIAINKPIERII